MTKKEIVNLAKKYITAANELDKEGLTKEAIQIDNEILMAIEEGLLPIKIHAVKTASSVKTAIRGQSDWNDYLENMAGGAGGAAGAALGSGVGAGFAAPAAAAGAGLGALGTWGSDVMFNHLQGQTSQLDALGNDLLETATSLAQTIAQYDQTSGQQIMQLATALQTNIAQIREQKRQEISQNVGLDPNKGFWQSANPLNWGKALNRRWQMTTSSNENAMVKTAVDSNIGGMLDPGSIGAGIGQAAKTGTGVGLKTINPLSGGMAGLSGWGMAGAGLGGAIGGMVGKGGYNWIANKMRGQAGIIQKQISDIQKIGASMAQISQDPTVNQITQQIAMLAQRSLQAIQQGQQTSQNPAGQPAYYQ